MTSQPPSHPRVPQKNNPLSCHPARSEPLPSATAAPYQHRRSTSHLGTTWAPPHTWARARAQTRALSALARLSTPARHAARVSACKPSAHRTQRGSPASHLTPDPPTRVRDLRPAPPTLMWQDRRNAAGVRHHDERGSLASDGQARDQAPKRVGYHGALAPSYNHPSLTLNSSGSGSGSALARGSAHTLGTSST